MARQKRIKSETGIYHVMLRGMNKQQVFLDAEDNMRFLRVLGICKDLSGFKLHAYCLMGNHVHLLIEEGSEPLDKVFKRIGDRYVYWYNAKYRRTGALFQGRYKSIPVNDDAYFISALRYIHQNPVKAKMVKNCEDYDFSSYNTYINPYYSALCDTEFTFSLMSIDEFKRIHSEPCQEKHLEISETENIRLTDDEAEKLFKKHTHCKNKEQFRNLPSDMQYVYANLLKKQHLSVNQICNLTGVSRKFLYK